MFEIFILIFMGISMIINCYIYKRAKDFYTFAIHVLNNWTAYTERHLREELEQWKRQ